MIYGTMFLHGSLFEGIVLGEPFFAFLVWSLVVVVLTVSLISSAVFSFLLIFLLAMCIIDVSINS